MQMNSQLIDFFKIIGIIMLFGLIAAMLLLAWVLLKVRKIHLPAGAEFFDAMRATPLSVVILLDLLDLGLDFFSAPISWVILGRLGLQPLRTVTMIKDLVPGTEMVPAMTIAWLIVTKIDKRGNIQAFYERLFPRNSTFPQIPR